MNRQPLRVMLVLDSIASEAGTENQLVALIRGMNPSRIQFFVACLEDSSRLQSLSPYATPLVYAAPGAFSLAALRQSLRFRRDVARYSIDIVHTFMVKATIFGVLAATASSCKLIVTSRRNLGYSYTGRLRILYRILNRLTTRIVANSEKAKAAAIRLEGVRPEKIEVLYNGVALSRFTPSGSTALQRPPALPPDAAVVGIVANYRPVKNLGFFLESAQKIKRQVPDAVFVLIGRGPLEAELKELAVRLGIGDCVVFINGQNDVADFLPWFRVACLTSHSESFSNAILEYMAAGLPVVASDVGGVSEAVQHGKTGFVVPPGDLDAFAASVVALLKDEPLRQSLARHSLQRCQTLFSMEAALENHARFYENLADVKAGVNRP